MVPGLPVDVAMAVLFLCVCARLYSLPLFHRVTAVKIIASIYDLFEHRPQAQTKPVTLRGRILLLMVVIPSFPVDEQLRQDLARNAQTAEDRWRGLSASCYRDTSSSILWRQDYHSRML
eukprot:SAG31_NODE_257_length_18942_cov_6.099135_4_plen_119_part_00